MRNVVVNKSNYDNWLWPIVTNSQAKSDGEVECAQRVVRKLKAAGEYEAPSAEEVEQAAKLRGRAIGRYVLNRDDAAFSLEEDEHSLIVDRLKAYRTKVSLAVLDEFVALVTSIETAQPETPAVAQLHKEA